MTTTPILNLSFVENFRGQNFGEVGEIMGRILHETSPDGRRPEGVSRTQRVERRSGLPGVASGISVVTFGRPGGADMTDPDAIARRAYELFQARGSEPGHEVDDWLQAEAELQAAGADEQRSTEDDAEPAITDERPSTRKRGGSSRRVARQPHTH
jgi:hypothetical protein